MKPKRNQPCPCGSGKKYKKCCALKVTAKSPPQPAPGFDTGSAIQSAIQYHQAGHFQRAAEIYQCVLQVEPNNADALHLLGMVAYEARKTEQAINLIKRAISIKPGESIFYNNLGNVLNSQGCLDDAIRHYKKALALKPDYDEAHNNLGTVLKEQEHISEAIECYRNVLRINPGYMPAYNNMALALQSLGMADEAIEWYQKALQLDPESVSARNNLLLALNYSSTQSREQVYEAHLDFAAICTRSVKQRIKPHKGTRTAGGRLKIGYVSPDFRSHAVAHFIEPVLENHDHGQFEIFAYYNYHIDDHVTHRLRQHCDHWKNIAGLSDTDVMDLIRQDQIDILVDLTGHTRNNRLMVFAGKPAPAQITWLGYPNTTGLPTMDYRITDNFTDPPGITDRFYSEQLIRLPENFSCYQAPQQSPEVGPLPALNNGYITFGSFNNLAKVTPQVISLWANVLNSVENSKLILKYSGLGTESTRAKVRGMFGTNGVPEERLILLGRDESQNAHLQQYSRVDIALDTFPYSGATTSCDALWMGVPLITLEGKTHASRVGVSQLHNLGYPELIASDTAEYISIAKTLSANLDHLKTLRSQLRTRMAESPLMDAPRFTSHLESAFRDIRGAT